MDLIWKKKTQLQTIVNCQYQVVICILKSIYCHFTRSILINSLNSSVTSLIDWFYKAPGLSNSVKVIWLYVTSLLTHYTCYWFKFRECLKYLEFNRRTLYCFYKNDNEYNIECLFQRWVQCISMRQCIWTGQHKAHWHRYTLCIKENKKSVLLFNASISMSMGLALTCPSILTRWSTLSSSLVSSHNEIWNSSSTILLLCLVYSLILFWHNYVNLNQSSFVAMGHRKTNSTNPIVFPHLDT